MVRYRCVRRIAGLIADNTLYLQEETKISELMTDRIRDYFCTLGLDRSEADELHRRYYKEYGLAIRGLVKHHTIDPLDYDAKCDASLPLDKLLHPNAAVLDLFRMIDRKKCRVYALTNAFRYHAKRVIDLLGLTEFFEAIVYCDYQNADFACKPEREFYIAANEAVDAPRNARCYFVDDSLQNVRAAQGLGWHSCGR